MTKEAQEAEQRRIALEEIGRGRGKMKNLKKNFAKALLKTPYSENGKLGIRQNTFSALLVGIFSLFPTAFISEHMPMDETQHVGSKQAMEQYNTALDYLSTQQKTELNHTPSGIDYIIQKKNGVIIETEDIIDKRLEDEKLQELTSRFGSSVIVDTRLNEKQKYELIQEFENRVGDFKALTSLRIPDFADIDEALEKTTKFSNEASLAKSVIRIAEKDVNRPEIFFGGSVGVFTTTLLILMSISGNRERLKSWASKKTYKKKLQMPH